MSNLVGTTLRNRYFLRQMVGAGGVADVYLAWDKLRSAKMAIKVLRHNPEKHSSLFQMFAREAEVLRKLEHPFIVRLYEFDREGKNAFLVMDWVDGTNLRETIANRGGPLSLGEVSQILEAVCSALNYAHQNRVFHCDIKPANILQHVDGRVLLSDFGVARLVADKHGGGTPPYMAPEQFLGQEVDARTDIYALGITMYEALSGGNVPFRGESPSSQGSTIRERIEWEHCNLLLPPLRDFNPKLPEAVINVIEKALSKDPSQRYPTTLALKEAIEQARAYAPTQDKRSSPTLHPTIPKIPQPAPKPLPQKPRALKPHIRIKGPYLLGQSGEWRGQAIQISKQELTVGRSRGSQLRLRERSISRAHATILRTRRGVYIRDEKSLLGTYVNGQRINGPIRLKHGDVIQIGYDQVFQFRER